MAGPAVRRRNGGGRAGSDRKQGADGRSCFCRGVRRRRLGRVDDRGMPLPRQGHACCLPCSRKPRPCFLPARCRISRCGLCLPSSSTTTTTTTTTTPPPAALLGAHREARRRGGWGGGVTSPPRPIRAREAAAAIDRSRLRPFLLSPPPPTTPASVRARLAAIYEAGAVQGA